MKRGLTCYSKLQALSVWIDQEEERSRLTREALDDVDAGRVIDHQAVQAWADSLSTDTPLPGPR
ncbi:CopG family transcriptional regulator [Pseudomonas gessardii]|nr:CopG family transcriptional regulator [Pseudomonas gessardii]NNA92927.1 CopG family transcriptional regulator [Pseudomonas gessardii]